MFLVRSVKFYTAFALILFLSACAGDKEKVREKQEHEYVLVPGPGAQPVPFSTHDLEALGVRSISSSYFDGGMGYENSRFDVIRFSRLLEKYPAGDADAVLLDCFDDYQGILSIADIKAYDIHLATRIELAPRTKRPGWLKPLLVIVPNGVPVPFQERFMTANIKSLRFVRLAEYYQPLTDLVQGHPEAMTGLDVYRDNCLFCHPIKSIGGNKGGSFANRFDFSNASTVEAFTAAFFAFHHKDNPDKQNLEQFVTREKLIRIAAFLKQAQG